MQSNYNQCYMICRKQLKIDCHNNIAPVWDGLEGQCEKKMKIIRIHVKFNEYTIT